MRVKMKVAISGTRDGRDWPAAGGCVDVDDREGAELCAAGLAEPCPDVRTESAAAPVAPRAAAKRGK